MPIRMGAQVIMFHFDSVAGLVGYRMIVPMAFEEMAPEKSLLKGREMR